MSLRSKLSIVALVYVIEGFPMGVYQKALPVYLRLHDAPLGVFGVLGFLYIAWSAKVLWSPLVDRFGERRQWIRGAMLVMAMCLAGIGLSEPGALGPVVWACIVVFCVASATQDVAIDAYSIGLADRGEEGPINSMKAVAYRIGMLTSGGALLFLPRWIGWPATFAAAALLCAGLAFSVRLAPPVAVPEESRTATIAPLREWLSQANAVPVLVFVLLYRIGDRAMGPMVEPFWVDRGFALEVIALVNTLGVGATILGAIIGGIAVARFGIRSSLWSMGFLALASNLGYAAAAAAPALGDLPVYGASLIESFTSGLAGAAFLSYLMRISQKEHAAVQYALLTAIYALSGSFIALPSGWLTERMGYAAYFALTAALALPAFALLPWAGRWVGKERLYSRA